MAIFGNRRNELDIISEVLDQAIDSSAIDASQLFTLDLMLANEGIRRAVARHLRRVAKRQGLDIETAFGDGTLLQLFLDNLPEIIAFIEALLKIFSSFM